MSTYDPGSEISRFNQSEPGSWFPVSDDTLKVAKESIRIGRLSGGALDVTIGSLVNLWGFGKDGRPSRLPSSTSLKAALNNSGFEDLTLRVHPPALRKNKPYTVSFSSIAKGFGVDEVAILLNNIGINCYMVEIGGEIRTRGLKPGRKPWRIGIETPSNRRGILKVVNLSDTSMATSGDYRNYIEHDGQRLSHIIDPINGHPVSHHTASVTVIAKSTMEADGLATALLVMGSDRGLVWAEQHHIAALFIDREDVSFVEKPSKSFKQFLKTMTH